MTWVSGAPSLRAQWGLDPSVTFLNHGSFGAAPRSVLLAQARWREEMESEPVEFFTRRLPVLLKAAREKLARFLGADPEGLVFVPNATTGASTVLGSLDLKEGDGIVITDHGYGAVNNAVLALAERRGLAVQLARVQFPLSSTAQIVGAVERAMHGNTRLIVVDHVTSPTALVFPVEQLVALGRGRIPVLVDGAHAPGMLALAIAALGADFYVGNLHKWLCAPKGAAFLWVAPKWREKIHPLVTSHGWKKGFLQEFDWTGTFDPSAYLSVSAAIDHLLSLGAEKVRESNHALVQRGREVVAEALRVELPHADDPALYGSMAAIPFPLREPATPQLLAHLRNRMYDEHKVEVPFTAFDHRIWVRPSGQVYNAPEDYEKLARALAKLLGR